MTRSGRRRGGSSGRLSFGHQPHRRSFVIVLVACWTIGLFGLAGHVSLLQLLVVGLCTAAWLVAAARQRRAQLARERWIKAGLRSHRASTTVRLIQN